mmetsp:Transcript_32007/g.77965  ORF Transcript_32007/g.77965 Transcript_32007/m.77965 type:complete len:298 (-) Transcript_32007:1155-2048(-)
MSTPKTLFRPAFHWTRLTYPVPIPFSLLETLSKCAMSLSRALEMWRIMSVRTWFSKLPNRRLKCFALDILVAEYCRNLYSSAFSSPSPTIPLDRPARDFSSSADTAGALAFASVVVNSMTDPRLSSLPRYFEAEKTVTSFPVKNHSYPASTHSCERTNSDILLSFKNLSSTSSPNTQPASFRASFFPRPLNGNPESSSKSSGSDQSKSSMLDSYGTIRWSRLIFTMSFIVMSSQHSPPWTTNTLSFSTAQRGSHLNAWETAIHMLRSYLCVHSLQNPISSLMSWASWFPRLRKTPPG